MVPEHYLLLILSILPLIYKYSFWFFTIQLKEYRWDRFKEYIHTPQGNSALVNIWSVLELPLLLVSFIVFFNSPFEIIIYNVLFVFLLIQNLFVIRKLLSRKFLKPKITFRLLLTLALLIFFIYSSAYYVIVNELGKHIYSFILALYLFAPLLIAGVIGITLPLVYILKSITIHKAKEKSRLFQKPIKIGITGSYGKSSIKEFLASILEQDGDTLKTPENINTELGVSSIISKFLNNKYKYFIAEMGAYKIGEINLLGEIVDHKYGFLTGIGNQHLGLFGSQSNIVKGKSEIINSILKNKGTLYANWNCPGISDIKFDKELKIVKYGNIKGSDTRFKILKTENAKTEFEFTYKGKDVKFKVALIGTHNIINITGVIAFCYDMGFKTNEIKKYLKNLKSPKNTLTIEKTKKYTLIDDSYNLSEEGLLSGLEVLSSFDGEKVLIVDDILELGPKSKKIHYKIGKKIAKSKLSDKILYVGINYKTDFLNGLFDGGYSTNSVLTNINQINKKSVILFEGRSTKKYINNFITNV